MKSLQNLINQFNRPDVHLVVSEWPEDGSRGYHGVASYTRETLMTLVKNHNMKFVVLAEKCNHNEPQTISNGKILVLRVFDHKHPSLYPVILTWLSKFSRVRHVTVHSEFGAYSGIKHFILLIPFLGLIKATGRRLVYVAHNVIDNIQQIAPQLNINTAPTLFNAGLRLYNMLLGLVTNQIVVLDINGYEILEKYVSSRKLVYNPHWVVPRSTQLPNETAKKRLGISPDSQVIMAFGFISWYKGSDLLAKLFSSITKGNKKYHLIVAGGKAPSIAHTPQYQAFYRTFLALVRPHKNITVTGFIPDKELGLYFAAADLVVFPYRSLMGGSGALAHAIGFGKPFLLSRTMGMIWNNTDLAQSLTETLLTKEDVCGIDRMVEVVTSNEKLSKLAKLSASIAKKRDIALITAKLYDDIYSEKIVTLAPSGHTLGSVAWYRNP